MLAGCSFNVVQSWFLPQASEISDNNIHLNFQGQSCEKSYYFGN